MNVEKLKRLQAQVRIGGKGTPRRKKKVTHQTAATDDKKLQSSLKKLSVSTIPGIEEVNIIKDDLTVIHFNNPKVQASLSSNTYAVTGHEETKKVVQMLPDILPQLGHETVVQLRMFANSITNNQKGDGSGEEKYKNNFRNNDDDDVPTLVSDFDEIAKSEDLTTGKLEMKLDNNVSNINVLKSDEAQDIIKSDNAKKTLTLDSDDNIEAKSIITHKERDDNDVLAIESFKNIDQCQLKKDIPEPDIKDEKKIQFQENNAKSLFKEKKSGEKNDRIGKKGSDSKRATEAHQANKNKSLIINFKDDTLHSKPDVNVLLDLTELKSVALKTDVDSLDQSTKTLEKKTHGLLEIISDKQSDSMVNFEAIEEFTQNIEAGCTISRNEICKSIENLSVVEPLCSESNKKEGKDISKGLSMEIEATNLEEKNQSIKIESIVCNEFIAKETKSDDAGNENKTLNEETASGPLLPESNEEKIEKIDDGVISRDTPNLILSLKMERVDMKPKVLVKGDNALNESLEVVPIIATLESSNVKNADLTLNVEGKTLDNLIMNKIVCNDVKEIEALQKHFEEDTLNPIILLEDSKTEDKQAKEIGNENKIQTETQPLKKATSVTTIVPRINNLTKNETKAYQEQELENSYGHLKEQTLSKEIEIEQNSQQDGELIGKTSLTLDQNKEKDINLNECITKECKSETKTIKIQENENNNALLKTQSRATDIAAKTELKEFQQTGEQKNIETLFTLGEEKEKDIKSSEKKVGSNAKITSKSVKQPPPKQNETKKQSLPGTSTKISSDLKKSSIVGKPKQLPLQKNRTHQISEGIIPKTQQLQKSAEGTLVKSEKETATQKTKQHQTVPTKTQKAMEVRSESAPKVTIIQNISVPNKGATEMTFPTPTTESGVKASTSQLVNQIPYTAEKHLTSTKMAKASLNKNETAIKVLKVPNKTDTNSASTGTTQKQTNPKVKQAKSTSGKTEPTSKLSQQKAKSSQKPVDFNERAS